MAPRGTTPPMTSAERAHYESRRPYLQSTAMAALLLLDEMEDKKAKEKKAEEEKAEAKKAKKMKNKEKSAKEEEVGRLRKAGKALAALDMASGGPKTKAEKMAHEEQLAKAKDGRKSERKTNDANKGMKKLQIDAGAEQVDKAL